MLRQAEQDMGGAQAAPERVSSFTSWRAEEDGALFESFGMFIHITVIDNTNQSCAVYLRCAYLRGVGASDSSEYG